MNLFECFSWSRLVNFLVFLLRVTVGFFCITNGVGRLMPSISIGHETIITSLTNAGFPTIVSYVIAYSEILFGTLLIVGFAVEALVLIHLLRILLPTHGIDPYHWEIITYGAVKWMNVHPFILSLIFVITGPGLFALWNPFKSLRAHLTSKCTRWLACSGCPKKEERN